MPELEAGFFEDFQARASEPLQPGLVQAARFLESQHVDGVIDELTLHRLVMDRPSEIKLGTNGAFLYGCLTEQPVPVLCSPACLKGLRISTTEKCPLPVWELDSNGKLQSLNPGLPDATLGLVFLATKHQPLELARPLQPGLTHLHLYYPVDGTTRYQLDRKISWDLNPTSEVELQHAESQSSSKAEPDSPPPAKTWFWLVVAAVVALVLIVAAIALLANRPFQTNENDFSVENSPPKIISGL